MRLDDYQDATVDTAIYPGATFGTNTAINYTILGLVGEAGEVAGKWKKVIRDDNGFLSSLAAIALADELADVLWYVARAADELGYSLEELAQKNLDKLNSRAERGALGGSGDNR